MGALHVRFAFADGRRRSEPPAPTSSRD